MSGESEELLAKPDRIARSREMLLRELVAASSRIMMSDLLHQVDARGLKPYDAFMEVTKHSSEFLEDARVLLRAELIDIYIAIKEERGWDREA